MLVTDAKVLEAFRNCWRAVKLFALARLRPTVCAAAPVYEPENVSDPFVAVRAPSVPPRATPEIVEFVRPALLRVPVRDGVNVWVLPEPTIVTPVVRPLNEPVEDASVCVAPVWVCPVGPRVVIAEVRYPLLFVHWEMFGDAKLDTVRPREEVAIADGTALAPVLFPSREFAPIAARPIVPVVVIVPPVMPLFVAMEVTLPLPLLLNVVQSVEVRRPELDALAF